MAMQIIANDETVRSNTVQGSKRFNSQSLATPAEKVEKLVLLMPAIKKVFDLMADDIVEIPTKTRILEK